MRERKKKEVIVEEITTLENGLVEVTPLGQVRVIKENNKKTVKRKADKTETKGKKNKTESKAKKRKSVEKT